MKYWERLLEYTQAPGYYFSDYPETTHFVCPDRSYLSSPDAVTYTRHLVKIPEEEIGWIFPKKSTSFLRSRLQIDSQTGKGNPFICHVASPELGMALTYLFTQFCEVFPWIQLRRRWLKPSGNL